MLVSSTNESVPSVRDLVPSASELVLSVSEVADPDNVAKERGQKKGRQEENEMAQSICLYALLLFIPKRTDVSKPRPLDDEI